MHTIIAVTAVIYAALYCTTPNCTVVKLKIAPLKHSRPRKVGDICALYAVHMYRETALNSKLIGYVLYV